MEKLYKKFVPYGKIYSLNNNVYYLVQPHPILKQDWERDAQQRWLVTKPALNTYIKNVNEKGEEIEVVAYQFPFHLVVTDPEVSFESCKEIYVETDELVEPPEEVEEVEPSQEDGREVQISGEARPGP